MCQGQPSDVFGPSFVFHFRSAADISDSTGSSIRGPITNARDISGLSGNVATAIANASGEFLAKVVRFNETMSLRGNPRPLPIACATASKTVKNMRRGMKSSSSIAGLSMSVSPSEANITATARHRNRS